MESPKHRIDAIQNSEIASVEGNRISPWLFQPCHVQLRSSTFEVPASFSLLLQTLSRLEDSQLNKSPHPAMERLPPQSPPVHRHWKAS